MTGRSRPPQGLYSIADLARQEGISEKSARGRLRKYFEGTLSDHGISNWTYGPEDLEFVLDIIRPKGSSSIGHLKQQSEAQSSGIARKSSDSAVFAQMHDPCSWPRKLRSELILPAEAGVYALFLRENASLPDIVPQRDGLIYIGRGISLVKRCHFNGKTESHSPRRSLAALLWHVLDLEPKPSANDKYKLSQPSEKRLDAWMHENLLTAFVTTDDFKQIEDLLIKRFAPPLNLNKCKQSAQHQAVKGVRKAMRHHAKRHH